MQIEYVDQYEEHGCKFLGRLGVIRYGASVTNHEFNSANRPGGIYDYLDKAIALANSAHPNNEVLLGIPDLVFRIK